MKKPLLILILLYTIFSFSQQSSTEVGVTAGQLSVSLTGGAVYDIPIAVPPGINGIVPQISLSYNSQTGNGLAGYGWNITGVSVITRISATKFHDGTIDAVDFDGLDRFSLDGQRLMVKNGTSGMYGADGTIYETESFSNIKITSYGVHPNGADYGPSYFKVEYPDGSFAFYGNGSNSRSRNDWAIMYWQNPQGVRISYTYTLSNNNLSISTIKYGTRLTTTPINEISFVYKIRQRPEQAYIGGQNFIRNTILSAIKVKGNGLGYRNYYLQHNSTSLGYERLTSLTEKTGDDSKLLNPTVFAYEDTIDNVSFNPTPVSTTGLSGIASNNSNNIPGDFDGDGKMDFIIYPTTGNDAKKKFSLIRGGDLNSSSVSPTPRSFSTAFKEVFPVSWLAHDNVLMPDQGLCVVKQATSPLSITFDINAFVPSASDIVSVYEKTHEFPGHPYTVECPNLPYCDLAPFPDSYRGVANRDGGDPIILDPDPGNGGTTDCPNPINISVSPIQNNQATITWSQTGTPLASSWEVYYFETGSANNPSNNDPVGTYTVVSQNSIVISNLSSRKTYKFFIRSICSGQVGTWVGPLTIGGFVVHEPGETQYIAIPKEYISGDFNGDGLTDVIAVDKRLSYQTVICHEDCYTTALVSISGGKTYFVNLDRRLTENFVNFSGNITITNDSRFFVADYNGDGKSDLYVFDSKKLTVYTLNDNNTLVLLTSIVDDNNINLDYPILIGDYNGDGKADFLIPKSQGKVFYKYSSNGISHTQTTHTYDFEYQQTQYLPQGPLHSHFLIPNDFNLDGKTDIIQMYIVTRDGGHYAQKIYFTRYFKNMSSGFEMIYDFASDWIPDLIDHPVPIFLNHNSTHLGQSDLCIMSDNKIYGFTSHKSHVKDVRLNSVTLGNGLKENITYSPLISLSTEELGLPTYESSYGMDIYPNVSIYKAPSSYIVSKITQLADNQTKQQLFRYYGAVSNVEGLGFLGFKEFHKTNWFYQENPSNTISTISKYDVSRRGALSETYTAQGAYHSFNYPPASYLTRTVMTYEDELLSNKVYKIKNTDSRVYNALEGSSKRVLTTYDNYNNPLSVASSFYNSPTTHAPSLNFADIKIFEYDNNISGLGTYYIGRPKKVQTNLQTFGVGVTPPLYIPPVEDTRTNEELYTYNSSQLLTKVQKKGHNTNYLIEENQYDVFGNVTKKTITANGLTPRITEYTYDPTGRFLLTGKDIEGLITTYSYNINNGSLLSEILPHNSGYPLTTTFEYDVWGRRTKVTDYLGKKVTTNYFKHPNDTKVTVVSNTSDSGNINYEMFNQLGQKIAVATRDISGSNWSTKRFQYDINGRITQESEPFFVYNPLEFLPASQWNTTSYDIYGRVTQQILYTGKTTNITYSGLTTTSDDSVKNTSVTKNAIGKVVSLTDNGGTITYKYYADGNLKVSDYDGIIVSIEQDGWGRKTKLTDPSAGEYTYEYNDFGELKKEISPNGTTIYTLDNFGKVTSKSINGTNTNSQFNYTYNPVTKLLAELVHTDSQENVSTTYLYEYDNYRRLWRTYENGSLANYHRETFFDDFGRVNKEYYKAVSSGKTSVKTVRNTYKNGYHWQIIDDATNQVLWQTNTTNARGQLTGGQFGNGVMVTNTYDLYGLPNLIKHQKTGGINPINMQLGTVFNPQRGNLMLRTNNLFDWDETFVYDELDRLTEMSKSLELIHYNDFKNASDGFFKKYNTDAVVTISNEKLKVVASGAYSGTRKTLSESAQVGEKFNFQIAIDKGTTQNVRIMVIETNPLTGAWNQSFKKMITASGVEILDFQHTVSEYSIVELHIDKSDTSDAGMSTYFFVDDFKAHKIISKQIVYDDRGRVENNSTIGEYLYENTSSPYRNTGINLTESGELYYDYNPKQNISYNAFKAPVNIFEEGKERLSFRYNALGQRSTMFYGGLQEDKLQRPLRKHYSADGTMEIKHNFQTGDIEFITYIGGDAYTAPVVFRSSYPFEIRPTSNYLFLHRDYQGTIIAVSNQEGQVVEKRLFDAWGNILKVQDGTGRTLSGLSVLDRGYTGHEHLQGINIIHMNGRLYDPVVHRFLQPDNFIQDPYNTQNFNRYGYCLNNPFMYTDPNGEFIVTAIIIGAVVGAYIGGVQANGGQWNPSKWNWSSSSTYLGIVGGAVVGGVAGGVGAAVTTSVSAMVGIGGFAGGAISGFAGGAASGFLSGFGMAGLPGGSGNPWRDGFKGALWGGFMGAGINGVVQGVVSWKNGANFWNGKQPVPIAPKPEVSVISEIDDATPPTTSNNNSTVSNNSNTPKPNNNNHILESKYSTTKGVDGNTSFSRKPFTSDDLINAVKSTEGHSDGFRILRIDGANPKVNANLIMSEKDFSLLGQDFSRYSTGIKNGVEIYNFGNNVTGALRNSYNGMQNVYRLNIYSQGVNYAFQITIF